MPYIFFRALKLLIYLLLLPIINLYKQFGVASEMIQPQSYKLKIPFRNATFFVQAQP